MSIYNKVDWDAFHKETLDHVLQCKEPSISDDRKALFCKLEEDLLKLQTPPTIIGAIVHGLQHWET
jgi:hypothetical protein